MPQSFFIFSTRIESEQFSQYGLQDSTVTVVVHFNRRVDSHLRLELDNGTIRSGRLNRQCRKWLQRVVQSKYIKGLFSGQSKRPNGLAIC